MFYFYLYRLLNLIYIFCYEPDSLITLYRFRFSIGYLTYCYHCRSDCYCSLGNLLKCALWCDSRIIFRSFYVSRSLNESPYLCYLYVLTMFLYICVYEYPQWLRVAPQRSCNIRKNLLFMHCPVKLGILSQKAIATIGISGDTTLQWYLAITLIIYKIIDKKIILYWLIGVHLYYNHVISYIFYWSLHHSRYSSSPYYISNS